MRLALGAIEEALANPAAFRARADAGDGGGFGYTYASALRNAIYRYHSTTDRNDAAEYLEESIQNSTKLRSAQRRAETIDQLDWYIEQHTALGWPTFDTRVRISVPVPARAADSLTCTCEVGRIDMVPTGGYAAWLLASTVGPDWRNELRMPLLQGTLADVTLAVPSNEIQVGIYDLSARAVLSTTFAENVILAARRRFNRLVSDLGF
jgi:hypothetical protein